MANKFWVDATFIPKEGEVQTESTYTDVPDDESVSLFDETAVDVTSVEVTEITE